MAMAQILITNSLQKEYALALSLIIARAVSFPQKMTLDNAINSGAPEPDRKRLEMIYKKTQSKIKYLEYRMPYVIYLPIYDFQYIKIVPKRQAGDIFIPAISMNITN